MPLDSVGMGGERLVVSKVLAGVGMDSVLVPKAGKVPSEEREGRLEDWSPGRGREDTRSDGVNNLTGLEIGATSGTEGKCEGSRRGCCSGGSREAFGCGASGDSSQAHMREKMHVTTNTIFYYTHFHLNFSSILCRSTTLSVHFTKKASLPTGFFSS